jgi:hypothetical protein
LLLDAIFNDPGRLVPLGGQFYATRAAIWSKPYRTDGANCNGWLQSYAREMLPYYTLPEDLRIVMKPMAGLKFMGLYWVITNTIFIHPLPTRDIFLYALAHELTHAEQFATGKMRLEYTQDEHGGIVRSFWDNGEGPVDMEISMRTDDEAYVKLPWEVEADEKAEMVVAAILNKSKWNIGQ